ncbi:MAG: amino acid adenylation domain-containing protein, partial [Pseudomonadales bacterium]|nr:amino acid adenylation domain-containing protein [Pseudomonadales bacterium]
MDNKILAAKLASLSPTQRETLLLKIREYKGKSAEASGQSRIKVTARGAQIPLSFPQQRLWFLDQFEGQNPRYNMPAVLRLEGALNLNALSKAFAAIVARHEILRTTFREVEGVGQQLIAEHLDIPFGFEDFSSKSEEQKKQYAETFFKHCFDLSVLPLFQLRVLKTGANEHLILLNFHHIIFDGWSVGVFSRELETFYNGFHKGNDAALTPLEIQYADFSHWQREYINDTRIEKELDFWRVYLDDAPELQLPLDIPRGEEINSEGARFSVTLSLSLSNELKKLSQEQGVTVYSSLLAVFMLLCSRYSGQADVVVGSPVANRDRGEIETLIGFFVNSLALRQTINPAQSFLQLQRSLQNNLREVWQHQSLPFEKLVDELNVPRVKNKTPIFQHLFVWQGDESIDINLDGLKVFPGSPELNVAKFDLTLTLCDKAGKIEGEIEYRSACYKVETIKRFAEHFENLVEQVVAQPNVCLGDFSLLTEQEVKQLESFNAPSPLADWQEKTLGERFEKQVEFFPDHIAVSFGEQRLSYQQLNARANQLAHFLTEQGVAEGTRVALYFERSIDLIVAIVAVLKCGAAYVPVDPGSAAVRNKMILDDAKVTLLLADKDYVHDYVHGNVNSINISTLREKLAAYSCENPLRYAQPFTQAYMIYTSGTTGKPKGVPINHFNVLRLFSQSSPPFDFSENDCWTLFHSYAFDFSVWEIWGALLFGGRLVIVPTETSRDPALFYHLLESEQVTVLNQTPSAFNQLVTIDQEQAAAQLALRYVVFGGEALNFPLLKPWVDRYGYEQPKLINMYGITETTVHVTWHRIDEKDFLNPISNVGRPLADLKICLLDESGQQVPLGAIGEIFVAGRGLSEGYWQRPELNAEHFIEKELAGRIERWYKSGDLAYYTHEGDLIYAGRNDEQVKIRGYRIELGEVNAQLKSCAAVRVSAVISDENNKQLLAFVVLADKPEKNTPDCISDIRKELAENLPQYMQPAFIYLRADLPLTHNGKIDKKQLLDQHKNTPVHTASNPLACAHVAPRNVIEEQLGRIWQEVLALEWVGIFDNFFELGGDSILSLQIISRAKKAGVIISAKQLFEFQTIAELAEVAKTSAENIVAIQGALRGDVTLNPIQHWFFDNLAENKIAHPDYWNQSLIFKLNATFTVEKLAAAWDKILIKHDQLRCSFRKDDSGWVGYFNEVSDINSLVVEQHCEEQALQSVTQQYEAALTITTGPLQQVVLLHCADQDYLFITIHHLLVDGVSWRIILDDLQALLRDLKTDLGLKSTSFLEANNFLNDISENKEFEQQIPYWEQHLLNGDRLFANKLLPKSGALRASEQRSLGSEITQNLIQESVKNYRNYVNELLLAGLLLSVQKTNNLDSLRIDFESHGRTLNNENMDLSQTVGWFTALYPQRFSLSQKSSLGDMLIAVKEQLRAVPQQGLAFGWLARQGKCTDLNNNSAELLFNYLGQVRQQSNDLFEWTNSVSLQQISAGNAALYPLEINLAIQEDDLSISCSYDAQRFSADTIGNFLDVYCEALKQLSVYCGDAKHFAYSQSDFPLLSLSDDELNHVCATLTRHDEYRQLENLYPLSPMQEGMLFHALHDESGETYFEQMTIEIKGDLDKDALQQAWELTLKKHPILRTGFIWDELPQAFQFVRSDINKAIQFYPIGDKQTLQTLLADERKAGFDLGRAGLIRMGIMPLRSQAVYLIFNFHHLILDGWSVSLVLTDLFRFYRGFLAGEKPSFQSGPAYEPFIRHLMNEDPQAADAFWREQLEGFERATSLPYVENKWSEENRSDDVGYETEVCCFSETLTQNLENFSKRHHLTLNTLFQGAWAYLLSRYAGDEKVVFGTTVSGRPAHLPQVEQTAGMFINTLPFSVVVPSGPLQENALTILQWLEIIQHQNVAMRPYESTSLSALQRLCGLGGGEHLFESIVVFENYPVDQALSSAEMPFEVGDVEAVWKTNFPLALIFVPGKQLTMKISYQRELFAQNNIQRVMLQLQHTLENFLEKAEKPVQEISLLEKAERVRMLQIWNQTIRPYPSESHIGAEFDAMVFVSPHHTALWSDAEVVSYQSLAKRANQLAHYLVAQGVGAETVVAYCGERSVNLFVSLLAIVKAGGAYLPLDPHYPDERLFYMLENAEAKLIICSTEQRSRFEVLSVPIIDDATRYEQQSSQSPEIPMRADQLALVIYTSGSTGQPKGIELTHRNVLRLVKNSNVVAFSAADTLLHYAPIAFDAATWEIWGGLLNGVKLVLAPPGHLDPEQFGQLVDSQGISHVFLTTALFHTMVEFNPEALGKLKVVMTGGEVVNAAKVRDLLSAYPQLRFVNLYGPAENTSVTSYYATQNAEDIAQSVPIGWPVSNTQVYILDQNLQPLPVGMVGELCTAGDGVARGYRFKPELTRKAFVPNPFAKVHGHGPVLYRSGDMARYQKDGTIEFLGRQDYQVKIRGQRIELGEVEAAIKVAAGKTAACQLRDVVVRAQKSARGSQLIAWVVLDDAAQLDDLKTTAAELLPAYMVPSFWSNLEQLPLTPNGKVDHRALPEPERIYAPQRLPHTEMEKTLAKIWETLLGLPQVGLHDNFFALGGDSILSIQVVSRAKRAGIRFSTKQLFENQSIAELVKVAGCAESLVAQQDALTQSAALTPIQHWFYEQSFAHAEHWNMSLLLQPASGQHGETDIAQAIAATEQALRALVSQHDSLRAIYPQGEQQYLPLDWSHPQMQKVFSVEELPAGEPALAEALNAAQASLDLEQGPLFRAIWYTMNEQHRLLIVAHHLIMDGVSWRILLEDLALAMAQQAEDKAINLGRKTTAFAHWSERLWHYAQDDAVLAQKAYWQRFSQEKIPTIQADLVADGAAQQNLAEHTQSQTFLLDANRTEQLLRQVPKAFQTEISDLLLTALIETLDEIHHEQGQNTGAHLIALEGHGREFLGEQYDTSRTVGWFTTLYPVLLHSKGGNDWGDKIKSLKQQLREVPGNGLGYGLLRYQQQHMLETGDIADADSTFEASAEAQVSFNYLGQTGGLFNESQYFQVAEESPGQERSATSHQPYLLDVAGIIQAGEGGAQLQIMWRYSDQLFSNELMTRWVGQYQRHLEALIDYCLNPQHGGRVPADFPLLSLSQGEVDSLLPQPLDVEAMYPSAPLQQGLWFHHKLNEGGVSYFEQQVVSLEGDLNLDLLEQAWQQICARHSIFRTAFIEAGDQPV